MSEKKSGSPSSSEHMLRIASSSLATRVAGVLGVRDAATLPWIALDPPVRSQICTGCFNEFILHGEERRQEKY